MDKKYKEAIPAIINQLPSQAMSEDDTAAVIAEMHKKSRRAKQRRIGKDGLFPGEELSVSRWWLSRDSSLQDSDSHVSGEELIRASLLELRARETQMQIILLLEALALEVSMSASTVGNSKSQGAPEREEILHAKIKKPRKPQDLNVLLDLFVDRLCIWQSMRTDDGNLNKAGEGPSQAGGDHSGIGADVLKTFCVDVVLPL